MSANNILHLCQKAAVAFLRTETFTDIPTDRIYEGITAREIQTPMIVCQCADGEATVPFTGNWDVAVEVQVWSEYQDTFPAAEEAQDLHHRRAGEVFAKFMTATAPDDLSNALEGFTAQIVVPVRQGWRVDNGKWISFSQFRVNCCGSDLSIANPE